MPGSLTVAVTGSTGFVGRSIVRELLAQGHKVRALVRDRQKAREALPPSSTPGLELVLGDVFDPRSLGDLLTGANAAIHLVGQIRESANNSFRRVHVDATAAVLAACSGAKVGRYLHMSALAVSDLGPTAYQRTKFEAERLVRRSGLDWTVFRPGLIHGADGEFVGLMQDLCSGHEPPYMFIPYFTRWKVETGVPLGGLTPIDPLTAPVHVGDVARAFAAALLRPNTVGEVYNLVGSETLSWPTMLREFRDSAHGNERIEPFGVPSEVASKVAVVAGKLGLGQLLPFDEGMAYMGGQDATADLAKARVHLGIEFAPFRASFRQYAEHI